MTTLSLLNDTILVCNPAEVRQVWTDQPNEHKYRVWTEQEVRLATLLDEKDLLEIVKRKKSPKGFVFKGQV